jgi:fatty-acyl-CoA synthase
VLDALPVTDVGKPYKLALRADATRRAIAEALALFDGVAVDAVIEDGTVIAAVTLPSEVDEPKVAATLARYTVPTRLTFQGNS